MTVPRRYTLAQWIEDFVAFATNERAKVSGAWAYEWVIMHFATKYPGEEEAAYREKRFSAALCWMSDNVSAVVRAGGSVDDSELGVPTSAVKALYVIFGIDHGCWPMPVLGIDGIVQLIQSVDEEDQRWKAL